ADAALVLPYDPVLDRLLLVEQFRMGPFGRGDPKPWVLEPVAGRVDPGETPETCAARECVEEAHLSLKALEHISSHYCSPGCSTEVFHCFVGLCNLEARNGGLGGLEVEHEDIATHVMSFDDAMALTQNGEINIGPLLLMLLWLQRERPRLRTFA
ncbi:MAG: NUDIX hydrolase, partial [Pseudomonadota bacterium]